MRILVDCRYTRTGRHDGISRFTAELVTELSRLRPVEMLISDERQLAMLPDLPWHRISDPTSVREPWVARQVNRLRPDVVYTPMQTMGTSGRRYAVVSTLHDLIYYTNRTPPRDLPWYVRVLWRLYHLAWWPQRMLLNRVDAVVTVSETTADLIRRHRLTRREVVVVPNASRVPDRVERGEPERVLVYMGSFMPYKDVDTIARALHELPDYVLHLMSRVGERDRDRLERLAPDGALVFHDGASDEEYAAVLERATAFVSASRDEGFGIPVIEAMGRGTPAVITDIPIFREIGAEAALYFRPGDAAGLARRVRELEGEWRERSAASRARAEHYDWARSARILLDLLERVGRERSR